MSRALAAAATLTMLFAGGAGAQQTVAVPHAADIAAVGSGFDARAEAIIRHKACDSEGEYNDIVAQMARDERGKQGEGMTTILIAKLHMIVRGLTCAAPGPDAARMTDQINAAVLAMRKDRQMGTEGTPCLSAFSIPAGDWDVTVRELTRLFHMDRNAGAGVLRQETIDHMWRAGLLAASGPLGSGANTVLAACSPHQGDAEGLPEERVDREHGSDRTLRDLGRAALFLLFWWLAGIVTMGIAVAAGATQAGMGLATAVGFWGLMDATTDVLGIPETENHRLMIETSRYLANGAILDQLVNSGHPELDEFREAQLEVGDWLLSRLHEIANHDFDEYNARPYTRYSMEAVANLYDFAAGIRDEQLHGQQRRLRTAAHIVLDLTHTRFAIGSNGGRRVVNYRRRVSSDPLVTGKKSQDDLNLQGDLYNYANAADHLVARSLVLGGQTAILGGQLPSLEIGNLVNAAVGSYRLPPPASWFTVNRRPMMHRFLLGDGDEDDVGVELHSRDPAFHISAGGVRTDPAEAWLGFITDPDDPGIAMPTTLIPTGWGRRLDDVIRFDGSRGMAGADRSENLCVYRGFACGLTPRRPDWIAGCFTPPWPAGNASGLFFLNTETCLRDGKPLPGPHFFLGVRAENLPNGDRWGVLEAFTPANQAPEAAQARAAEFIAFRNRSSSQMLMLDSFFRAPHNEPQTYTLSTGERVEFNLRSGLDAPPVPTGRAEILSVDGQPLLLPSGTVGTFIPGTPGAFGISGGGGRWMLSAPDVPSVTVESVDGAKPTRTGP